MNFKYTTAISKLRRLTRKIKIVPGGTSASKTFGILSILIDQAARTPDLEISVVSESVPHLRKGALKDFLNIMKSTGRYFDQHYNRTLLTYTFGNGSYIEFFSADEESKVRGPRRHILYVNECNNISFQTYHQLAIRTSHEIWMDFNPSHEFWVHTELSDDIDTEWLTLTYRDNEALPESIVREIEKAKGKAYFNIQLPPGGGPSEIDHKSNIKSSYWHNWWRVYGQGQLGSLEGVIFTNWTIINSVPPEARRTCLGLDFGYTNDPTALIDRYYWNGITIYDEIIYQTGLQNNQIANLMRGKVNGSDRIWADSAEPKSIDEIRSYGFNIWGVDKGRDSVNFGIGLMQEENFQVTARSVNLIKELRNYTWDTDRDGKHINKPIDSWNHAIDAARYAEMMEKRKFEWSL